MLKWNVQREELRWRPAGRQPADYLDGYRAQLEHDEASGVIGVWATAHGAELEIYTLIVDDRKAEDHLHQLELNFFDNFPDAPVQFHITRNREALQEQLAGAEPVLVRS